MYPVITDPVTKADGPVYHQAWRGACKIAAGAFIGLAAVIGASELFNKSASTPESVKTAVVFDVVLGTVGLGFVAGSRYHSRQLENKPD